MTLTPDHTHTRPWPAAVKRLESKQGQNGVRFKVMVSDGEFSTACILASQLAHLPVSGEVRENTIVDIQEALQNQMGAKK